MSTRRHGSTPLYEARHGTEFCKTNRLCVECGKPHGGRKNRRWCQRNGKACLAAYMIRASPSDARRYVFDRDKGVCCNCGLDTDALRDQIKSADKRAFVAFLEEWNRQNPKGWSYSQGRNTPRRADGSYPRTHVGFSPGGSWPPEPGTPRRKRRRRNRVYVVAERGRLWELVRENRLLTLERLDQHRLRSWWWRKTLWDMDHLVAVVDGGGECGLEGLRTLCVACHARRSGQQTRRRAGRGVRLLRRKQRRRRVGWLAGPQDRDVAHAWGCVDRPCACAELPSVGSVSSG